MTKPNILYIFTDQQFAGAMSCAGNPYLNTPHMDRLDNEGTRFERGYCGFPLCVPSRFSMLTGHLPSRVGIQNNDAKDYINQGKPDQELGPWFGQAGYDCAWGGKWHIGGGVDVPEGRGFKKVAGFNDNKLAQGCIDFLDEDRGDKPFFLVASFDNPHNICEYARQQDLPWGPIPEPDAYDACPPLPANYHPPMDEAHCLREERKTQPNVGCTDNYTDEDWRRYRWAYYRLVEKVDAEIGKILDHLDAKGLTENTLVIFSSDHGDGHGAHQWNQKWGHYEESIRVPFIMRWPGVVAAKAESDALVSNGIDLFPTLCDAAGIDTPDGLPGASVLPMVSMAKAKGDDAAWREHLVVESSWHAFGNLQHCGTYGRVLLGPTYKYTCYSWGRHREQLIDLHADPGEMVNLAECANHKDDLLAARAALKAWCDKTGDGFKVPSGIFEG